MATMTTGLITAIAVFVVTLVAESVTSWMVIRGARKHHPVLWCHAGRPTLIDNGDLMRSWPLVRYFMRREFHKTGNQPAITFAERLRAPFVYSYFLAWGGVVYALVYLLVFHQR
jgi:hypothetical protein